MKHQLILMRKLMLMALLLLSTSVWAQQATFREGIRQGMVKVKFNPSMTQSLSQMNVSTRSNKLSTGIGNFDKAAQATKATNMYRLFPYDAKNENKLRKHGLHLWYVVELEQSVDPKTAVLQFEQLSEVEIAETDHEKTIAPYTVKNYQSGAKANNNLPFNDPYLADQWHYNNTGQTGIEDGADINLFSAWTANTGASNIIVSVHDEGVDVNHEDLAQNIWTNLAELNGQPGVDDDGNGFKDDIHGYNFQYNKGEIDAQFHGTHVAGTIAAINNNGKGVSGVAGGNGNGNGVKIMSLQILGGAPIERSFVYAANNGAVISQNSWGYTSTGYVDQSVLDAIGYFIAEAGDYEGSPMKGGIVIFAAGNSNYDGEWYPGYHESILSVSALAPNWKKAGYSNLGAWVDIAAPGGDIEYGSTSGVLSTIPSNKYAYLDGTSMACPHVSGVAALALANRNQQLTNTALWNKLVTGVVAIDSHNPDYVGLLGSGALDASLAIRNDQKIAPNTISNLTLAGIAQEFATLTWTVPADGDDDQPSTFELYYHTSAITSGNLNSATKVIIPNSQLAASSFSYEVSGLLGLSTYHFALTATDRWGNVSLLSNTISGTTNAGPAISVDENSQEISLAIDVTSLNTANHEITIMNGAEGILRWSHSMRHKNTSLAFNARHIDYPVIHKKKSASNIDVISRNARNHAAPLRGVSAISSAFSTISKSYAGWATNIIGETDTALTNSAAAKFFVSEADGFNLTQVQMYLNHDPAKGPIVLEVYQGSALNKQNLVYAQEYNHSSAGESTAYITLEEQLYFESGSTFWIVFHVPSGNLYPLGIGYENEPSNSTNCLISFDLGGSWMPLEEALNSKEFAYVVTAVSENAHLGNYLSLSPASGDILGNAEGSTTLTAQGAQLVNGDYQANMIVHSNDAQNQELRIPVNLSVSGHLPQIIHTDMVEYGSVFLGDSKSLEIVLDNQGYGNFNNPTFEINNPAFTIEGSSPWQIKAREEATLTIKFSPSAAGNANASLSITNGTQTYKIALFGVGAETSKIEISPEIQVFNALTIGDEVQAEVQVKNTGAYPLKYFIPGYDEKGISNNWPSSFHSYGYKLRSNYAQEGNPIGYGFQDISATGTNITSSLIDDGAYYTLDMGFEFPYYGQNMQTIYIAQKGFTTFDNSVRPINSPSFPGNEWSPKGIISVLGAHFSYLSQGQIFYQVEADRVIIQYDNVWDGWTVGEAMTAQMVLYANGDIRFFYDEVTYTDWNKQSLNIFIEDLAQQDGFLLSEWDNPTEIYSGLALGFDYPGPNIITAVSNGSGLVFPGDSAVVNITLSTETLVEGNIKRYVNFISNDPINSQKSALVQLEITEGGMAQAVVSVDSIAFGDVFVGEDLSYLFTIKNPGTASLDLAEMSFAQGDFSVLGNDSVSIKPGLYEKYTIVVPTETITGLEDWLHLHFAGGASDSIYLSANIIAAPGIDIDLSLVQDTLAFGATATHALSIQNPGLNNLEIVATGKQWLTFSEATGGNAQQTPDYTYLYEKNNDGSGYQWLDIRKTGTQMPFPDWNAPELTGWWRELELPFPIDYYGQLYSKVYLSENGAIAFEPQNTTNFFVDNLPTQTLSGPLILPYWTFSVFSDFAYPLEDIGIFYQFFDDKIVLTWSYFTNNFGGMGDPVSAQAIFFKNGTMKFQYKREEGGADATSQASAIGLQRDSQTAITISQHAAIDHGAGLAYFIVPAIKHTIAPGSTLDGQINLNAENIYGGQYNQNLTIHTNVPGSKVLAKPIELTVIGTASLQAIDTIDFGKALVKLTQWGDPDYQYVDLFLVNDGAAQLEITWAEMADAAQGLNLMLEIDGWFGKEWSFISNIYSPWAWETPVFSIKPGDKLPVRAAFGALESGDFASDAILTTNVGEFKISMKGTGFEPPVIEANKTPIYVSMNTLTETATRSIMFNNTTGKSDLEYNISIDFGRTGAHTASTEAMATTVQQSTLVFAKAAQSAARNQAENSYNRILKHNAKDTADTFVGTGGSSTFTVATRYNAGPEGFNLSHIETFFRAETLRAGKIEVEIRAGGNNIAVASLVGKGSIDFSYTADDAIGGWKIIELENATGIYPNEDFYVVVTYPLGIQFPQGTVDGEPTVEGRYYYLNEGIWNDIQQVTGFATMGWQMLAAEAAVGNFTWLKVSSAKEGSVAIGDTTSIEIMVEGAYGTRGNQVAHVVISHNDINKAAIRVPVNLHINEAPKFSNVPAALMMAEKDTMSLIIGVSDLESHAITITAAEAYEGVSHQFDGTNLMIQITPDYGDAGFYDYTFTATDVHEASKEMTISIEVVHTNQAPGYIGNGEPMVYNATGSMLEYQVADFFADPDQDHFTFTVSSEHDNLVEVFANSSGFLVRPLAVGETSILFTLTDIHGAVSHHRIPVNINKVLAIDHAVAINASAYPNPVQHSVLVKLDDQWTGTLTLEVMDISGKKHLSQQIEASEGREVKLDMSSLSHGLYVLKISTANLQNTIKLIKE